MDNVDAPSTPRALTLFGVALLSFLTLAGCAENSEPDAAENLGQSAQAIEGGYGDLTDWAVVGLVVTDGDGHIKHTCSGALIAPNLVLTAQHCVASTPRFVRCAESVFGQPVSPERVYVTLEDSMWGAGARWLSVAQVIPPHSEPSVCGHDIALLRLSEPLHDMATPLTPRLDENVAPGETYSAVGFGASGKDVDDAGRRRRRDHLEIVCVGQSCSSASHVQESEWLGDHGICNGDSGGPAIDEAGRVIGVISRGPLGCDDPIYSGLTEFKDWIQEEAIQAARAGDYLAASWTGADFTLSSTGDGGKKTGASCALRANGFSDSARSAVLFALAALALLRRRV